MLDIYSLVQKLVGSSLLLWGLAIIINKHIIPSYFKTFVEKEDETLTYLTAGMFLTMGLIIVWTHNDWYLDIPIIITILGWVLVIKAMLWILFPKYMVLFSKKFKPLVLKTWFRIVYGVVLILIGILILLAESLISFDF